MSGHGDHEHAIRFGIGRSHFGDKLVRRDADGTGDVVPSGDLIAYPSSDGAGTLPPQQRAGDVHIAFIHGNLFDAIGDAGEHLCEDTSGHLTVVVDIHRQKDAVRA